MNTLRDSHGTYIKFASTVTGLPVALGSTANPDVVNPGLSPSYRSYNASVNTVVVTNCTDKLWSYFYS